MLPTIPPTWAPPSPLSVSTVKTRFILLNGFESARDVSAAPDAWTVPEK